MNATAVVARGLDPGHEEARQALDKAGPTIPATALRVVRSVSVLFFSSVALLQIGLMLPFVGAAARATWLHRWCRFACRVLGIRLTSQRSNPAFWSARLQSSQLSRHHRAQRVATLRLCRETRCARLAVVWLAGARGRNHFCRAELSFGGCDRSSEDFAGD